MAKSKNRSEGQRSSQPAAAMPSSAQHAHAAGHGSGHGDHSHAGEAHLVPVSTYAQVIFALMVFLIITLGAAYVNLGVWNFPIAMVIAVIKAGIVVVFFMHLKWSSGIVRFMAGAAIFWLCILFAFTLMDFVTRHWYLIPSGS